MSLYGLDLAVDQEGKPYLLEINGVRSGMRGFQQIYGDNRVQEQVGRMLGDKYGTLTVNNGTYSRARFRRQHPFQYTYNQAINALLHVPLVGRYVYAAVFPKVLTSPRALIDWLREKEQAEKAVKMEEKTETIFDFFPAYEGQDSTVLNLLNDKELSHPVVNPYVAEEIAGNKLLQYLVLEPTPVRHVLPPTTVVGLGWVARDFDEIVEQHSSFALKPILGSQGMGVQLLNQMEARNFQFQAGPVFPEPADRKISLLAIVQKNFLPKKPLHLEDLVEKEDFMFEHGVAVLQPFIDTRSVLVEERVKNKNIGEGGEQRGDQENSGDGEDEKNGEPGEHGEHGEHGEEGYSSIRAIVCNGQFVDAYRRFSPQWKVNLAQGATAKPYAADGLAEFCEFIVETYERACAQLNPETFRKDLYTQYMREHPRAEYETIRKTTSMAFGEGTIQLMMVFHVKKEDLESIGAEAGGKNP